MLEMAGSAVILQLRLISLFFCCATVSGAFLQYGSTSLISSPSYVTLTVGGRERVLTLQPSGPLPTTIEWYNPQGQLVSKDGRDEINQAVISGGRAARLNFLSYQQNQGGRYECKVTSPGNNSESLSVCIGPTNCGRCGCVVGVHVTPSVQNTSPTLTVTWQAVAVGVVSYTVQYSTQPGGVNTPPERALQKVKGINSTSTILTALERGTTYYIWVVGMLQGGEGPRSNRMSRVTYDNVPQPTDGSVSVMALNEAGKVRVTWSRPTLGPGQVITGYSVQYRKRGTPSYTTRSISASSTTSYTIANLNLGTVYEVRVASNGPLRLSGYCCGSGKQVTTYNYVPQPTDGGVSLEALNEAGKVRVTWSRPTLGPGQVITGYSVQYRRRGTPSYTTRSVSGSSTTSYTIANLNLGAVYEVRVASNGPLGLSGYCCGSGKQVTTYNYVSQPTDGGVSVVALNEAGKVRVTWSRPTVGPGQVITGYSVQYRRRGTPSYTTRSVSGSSTTLYTIINLNLGAVYEVRVASVGPLGLSGYCCGSGKQVTTYNIPDQVNGVRFVHSASENTLSVEWSRPQSDVPILYYEIRFRRGTGSHSWQGPVNAATESVTLQIIVVSSASYGVHIRAVSSIGEGPYSLEETVKLLEPLLLIVETGSSWLYVEWNAQSATFRVLYRESGAPDYQVITPPTSQLSHNISALQPNTLYNVVVEATHTLIQQKVNSSVTSAYTTPQAPAVVSAQVMSSVSIRVSWTPAPSTSSVSVTYYINASSPTYQAMGRSVTDPDREVVISGLHPFAEYYITVQAGNPGGLSEAIGRSATTLTAAPSAPPVMQEVKEIGARWAMVGWRIPSEAERNGIIIAYIVQLADTHGAAVRNETVAVQDPTFDSPQSLALNLTSLKPYTRYLWTVAATTTAGAGPFTSAHEASSKFRTIEWTPGPVSELSYENTNTSVTVTWKPPKEPNGDLVAYFVEHGVYQNESTRSVAMNARRRMSTVIQALEPGVPYNITVRASTSVGKGEPVSIVVFTVEQAPTSQVSSVQVERVNNNRAARVSWTPLTLYQARGFPVYFVTYHTSSQDGRVIAVNTVNTTDSRVVIDDLDPTTEYNITVDVGTAGGKLRGTLGAVIVTLPPVEVGDSISATAVGLSLGGVVAGALGVLLIVGIVVGACRLRRTKHESSPGSKAVGEEVPMDTNPAYGEVHIYDSVEEQKGDYDNL